LKALIDSSKAFVDSSKASVEIGDQFWVHELSVAFRG
jgi:hypothetical protein